jgi:DNA-binding PadR family transcriptional regulator
LCQVTRETRNNTKLTREVREAVYRSDGVSKADITRELIGIISKKTIYKLVDEMVENGIIEVKKDKENSRNHKLYLKGDNPMVYVRLQLNEFGHAFENLLYYIYYIIRNIKQLRTNQFPYQSKEEDRSKMYDANFSSLL